MNHWGHNQAFKLQKEKDKICKKTIIRTILIINIRLMFPKLSRRFFKDKLFKLSKILIQMIIQKI